MAKKVEKEIAEKQTFNELIEELNKKYSNTLLDNTFILSSGSIALDAALGGGYVSGRIVELIAWEGAGKTTLCLHMIAEAQKRGFNTLYIDAEHHLSKEYSQKIGVDWDKMALFQPQNGEEAFEYAKEAIKSGLVQVVIFDSTSGMLPKVQMEGEAGESNMGKHALLFNKQIPIINSLASKHGVLVCFVSQIREKIGVMFGSPETQQAGNSLRFFASTRIDLRKSLDKTGEEVTGLNTKFKTIKCKTYKPYQTGSFPISFGIGIDKITEILELGNEYSIFKKWGSTVTYEEVKYPLDEFTAKLATENEFYQELKEKLLTKLKEQ